MARVIENPKQLILSKAKEILYNQGYHKLSMRALSKACNIALGTIYNYYPTKKDLIIEMMTDYWQNYLDSVHKIVKSNTNIYIKLNNIFNELEAFIRSFRQYWLTSELYDSQEYVEGGLQKQYVFMEKLIVIIEDMLLKEQANKNIQIKLSAQETASFIIMNFITIVQMPLFKYESFELFLKELLE
ncbi:TetR/AcrR family transcriptional regulator [Clostridium sp. D2Q-11]|uniref:TetR/AcrR family transcriptional regulator n=1 Tax=Anaeromonas frigoriresistens TaxID=2683708 RepID=A0A942Z9R6_9FIRM|nr:TetR/AcrR family transcriptional regulator [Anaeromonas frigoriresistens]MBS4539439.1 TetR/AcrR family transcriptional regulator [Anaeromonas frigoriresistens]